MGCEPYATAGHCNPGDSTNNVPIAAGNYNTAAGNAASATGNANASDWAPLKL